MKKTCQLLPLILCALVLVLAGCSGISPRGEDVTTSSNTKYRVVTDSRGISVNVPANIRRVVTIDDGTALEIMTILGVEQTLVGVGSRTFQEVDNYTFQTVRGSDYHYTNGMNTMTYLHPWAKDLPVIAEFDGGVNYEGIVSLDPDVIIVELGSCTFWTNDEQVQKAVERIDSLGIPLIVLRGTDFYETPNISTLWEEVRIVGRVFGREERATEVASFLQSHIDLVMDRTENISPTDKPRVLYLGLAYVARDEGGAGNTVSTASFESYAIEEIIHARNAFTVNTGYWHIVSGEQVLTMDPDVIILPTDWGYHPVRELYEAPYYQNLQSVKAIKNRRVASLPWTPYDCAKRLEYPIEVMVMAKAVYPERFKDIALDDWILAFYQELYGIDRAKAEGLRTAQWMDWVIGEPI